MLERDVAFEESAKAREEFKARDKQTNELAKIDDHEGELIKQSSYLFHAPHYS